MSFNSIGATEFRNGVRQQKSTYSIFTVKLPIEELVTELHNGFINDRFIEEGIYIPAWHLSVSDPWLDRVDLLATN